MILEEESFPSLDEDYLDAQDIFYFQFNDIDIYVEDIDQEELYKEIFSKILPYKIGQIFPLGGKSRVIDKAMVNRHVKRKIFVVDKDFDDLHGKIVKLSNLFYLDKYCIENYLITKSAIVNFLKEEFPKMPINEIEDELKFDDLYKNTIGELTELFIYFFLIQKLGLPMENCSCTVDKFLDEKVRCKIDDAKCLKFMEEIQQQCELFGLKVSIIDEKKALSTKFNNLEDVEPHIPGKHLLALFFRKTSTSFKITRMPNKDSLYYRLAKSSGFENLNTLKDNIMNYAVA